MNCPHGAEQNWPHDPACETLRKSVSALKRASASGEVAEPVRTYIYIPITAGQSDGSYEQALATLRECELTFRNYEQLHLAKGTQDGDEKAHRNKQMADKCAEAITSLPEKAG